MLCNVLRVKRRTGGPTVRIPKKSFAARSNTISVPTLGVKILHFRCPILDATSRVEILFQLAHMGVKTKTQPYKIRRTGHSKF